MDRTRVVEEFRKRFGREPEAVGVAPGRINLIGEHTDYSDGFVFPAAIDRRLYMAVARVDARASELESIEEGEGGGFDAVAVEPPPLKSWSKYGAGMAWALRDRGELPNLQVMVGSEIPVASGISSSAAMEMAFGVIWNELSSLGLSNKDLALRGQRCENGFIGLQSGIMDQMASAMGKAGHAIFLDTRSLDITYAKLPEELAIALCDTHKSRELAGSAYNERRKQCEEASQAMGIKKLRDATMEMLERSKDKMPEVAFRRARHVITENRRCQEFYEASERSDEAALGELMRASHASLRDDFEVTSRELDAMADAANAAPGCVGARMTGAGFGGACVALVQRASFEEFQREVEVTYTKRTGLEGAVSKCEAVDGAKVMSQ